MENTMVAPSADRKELTLDPGIKLPEFNNILYVDDEPVHLKIFKITFGKQYNVFTAVSGQEGLEILKKEDIHLLITDQRMPKMTGTELLEKTTNINSNLIKIILTGFSDVNTIERAVNNCGIYKYITKPYDKGQMKLTLEKAMEMMKLKSEKEKLLELLNDTNQQLEEKVETRTEELNKTNKKLIDGLESAKNIQESLLPKKADLDAYFKESFIIYRPLDHVGGDFYWLDEIEDRHGKMTMLSVFDCMGHGVSGALLTMVGESFLSQAVYERKVYHPDFILEILHEKLANDINSNLPENDYQTLDMSFVLINQSKGVLEFSGAKMDLIYVNKKGEIVRVKGDRKSLGSSEYESRVTFNRHTIEMDDIECLYLMSDGYRDQMKLSKSKENGIKNMPDRIASIQKLTFEEQRETLENSLDDWLKNEIQVDDITLLGIKL